MICPNCSTNFDDGMMFCPNCGAPANANNGYSEPQYSQQNNSNQNEPYTMPNYGMPNNYYQQAPVEKTPSIGQYLGWMLIGSLFGPISIIISIVFACMGENKNRANFFRAHLIIMGISVVIAIIAVIAVAVMGFSVLGASDIMSYEMYDEYLRIASTLIF